MRGGEGGGGILCVFLNQSSVLILLVEIQQQYHPPVQFKKEDSIEGTFNIFILNMGYSGTPPYDHLVITTYHKCLVSHFLIFIFISFFYFSPNTTTPLIQIETVLWPNGGHIKGVWGLIGRI